MIGERALPSAGRGTTYRATSSASGRYGGLRTYAVPRGTALEAAAKPKRPFLYGLHPLSLAKGAPWAAATILIGLAVVLYVLQANQANVLELKLSATSAQTLALTDINSELQVQAYKLRGIGRIQNLAVSKLRMVKPDPKAAIWLDVTIPAQTPQVPYDQHVDTSPLAWMRSAVHSLWSSM